jgi:hypothetical protein
VLLWGRFCCFQFEIPFPAFSVTWRKLVSVTLLLLFSSLELGEARVHGVRTVSLLNLLMVFMEKS